MGAFVGLVLSVVAVIAGAVLLVRSIYGSSQFSGTRGVALDITTPIAGAIGAPFRWIAAAIGRASCRERVCQFVWIPVVAVTLKTKNNRKTNKGSAHKTR